MVIRDEFEIISLILTVIFITKQRAFLFPHAVFASKDDETFFRDQIKQHVPPVKTR